MTLVKDMRNQKKKISYQTEEQKEMMHFLIVLGVVVVLVCGVYFISKMLVMDDSLFEPNYQAGTVNSERAIVGTMLNRPEKEYYVMIYDETVEQAVYYSAISSKYKNKQSDALKVYHVDLNHELNQKYYSKDGSSNKDAKTISEMKFKDLTLIKVKDGKPVKYLEDLESIQKELAVTKEK